MFKNIKFVTTMLLFAVLLTGCSRVSYLEKEEAKVAESQAEELPEQESKDSTSEENLIYVQVAGAVVNPGVYQLPEDARVFNAIELAGGLADTADDSGLNQAALLSDGEKIYVYTLGERELLEAKEEESKLVDLNKASLEQLCSVPGIGESRAKLIIAYREEQGMFSSVEDIMKVQGIKEGTFAKIKEYIKV